MFQDLIKKNWPSAVEGEIYHSDLGKIHYWSGEEKNKIVVRFTYEGQTESDSKKVFFINSNNGDWILSQISTFHNSDSKLKLIKIISFKEFEELEEKYSTVIELFMQSRKSNLFF